MLSRGIVSSEHDAPDLDGTNPSDQIQFSNNRLTRELFLRDIRKKSFCIDIDCMAPRRLKNRHARLSQFISQIFDRAEPVCQIVFVKNLIEPLRDRFQISPRESRRRSETLPSRSKDCGRCLPGFRHSSPKIPPCSRSHLFLRSSCSRQRRRTSLAQSLSAFCPRIPFLSS